MVEFLGEHYNAFSVQRQTLNLQVDDLDREIAVVKRKLKAAASPRKKETKGIEIVFKTDEEQEIGIEGAYAARGASWEPVYKVDVPIELNRVGLTMFASIRQRTGEDWDGVALSVSNAVPVKGTVLPQPASWYLSLPAPVHVAMGAVAAAAPAPRMRKAAAPEAEAEAGCAEELALLDEAVPAAEFSGAAQKELPHAFEYELSQRISVGSGQDETLVPLFTKEQEGEFFCYAAPRFDPQPYLVCRAAADRELLPGTVNVYFGGRFVGGTTVGEKKAGEDLLFNLGVDRSVKVRREKVHDSVKETFFKMVDRGTVPRDLAYRTVIENLKETPVRVWLLDAIPVSRTDKIQVKNLTVDPAPTKKDYEEKEGVLFWDLTVPGAETQEIRLEFTVAHPKAVRPVGL
jgi:uncharacterized protein (TIGR02231 family)